MERLRLKERGLELEENKTPEKIAELDKQREELQVEYNSYTSELEKLYGVLNSSSFSAKTAAGTEVNVSFSKVVRAYRPNAMSLFDKCIFILIK